MLKKDALWCVDLLNLNSEAIKNSAGFIQDFHRQTGASILPIYVNDETVYGPVPECDPGNLINAFQNLCQQIHLDIPAPQILSVGEPIGEASGKAQAILTQIQSMNPKFILINAPGKRMMERVLMGSISEELLLRADVPLVFISEHCAPVNKMTDITFLTDLSADSVHSYHSCVDFFFGWAKKLSLVTEVIPDTASAVTSAFAGAWVNFEPYPADEIHHVKQELGKLAEYAQAKGYDVKTTIENSILSTSQALRTLISTNLPHCVAMSTQSTALEKDIFGSVGRDILYQSPVPVWVAPLESNPRQS